MLISTRRRLSSAHFAESYMSAAFFPLILHSVDIRGSVNRALRGRRFKVWWPFSVRAMRTDDVGAALPRGPNSKKPAPGPGAGFLVCGLSADYATRTDFRNLPTSSLRRPESDDSDRAEDSTCDEAVPVSPAPRCTSVMLEETCWVPRAACCTLREISWVAAPCSSTAAAMVEDISDNFSIVVLIAWIAPTDSWVAAWMPVICWPISPVAFEVCSASAFTSDATTAKPRP